MCRAARGGRAPGEVWGAGPASRLRGRRNNAEGSPPGPCAPEPPARLGSLSGGGVWRGRGGVRPGASRCASGKTQAGFPSRGRREEGGRGRAVRQTKGRIRRGRGGGFLPPQPQSRGARAGLGSRAPRGRDGAGGGGGVIRGAGPGGAPLRPSHGACVGTGLPSSGTRDRHSHWRQGAGRLGAAWRDRGTPAPRGISAGVGPPAPPALRASPPPAAPLPALRTQNQGSSLGFDRGSAHPSVWEGLTEEPGISHELRAPLPCGPGPRPAPRALRRCGTAPAPRG